MQPIGNASFKLSGKLALICFLSLFGFVFALYGILLSPVAAVEFVRHWGYWFILSAFLLFAFSLWRLLSCDGSWRIWKILSRWQLMLIGAGGLFLTAHQPLSFKILMDEPVLLGTSLSMHWYRFVQAPLRGGDLQGVFHLLQGNVDKRPLFYPFLVSLVHDLTGYRPENAFYVNVVLAFVLLALVGVLAKRLAGDLGVWTAVLLLCGLPLLGENATGGGFELLNLVMFVVCVLLGLRFYERRDEISLSALGLASLLLIQTRYESAILALPIVLVVGWVWWQERKIIMGPLSMLLPLLLLPAVLHLRIFEVIPDHWQLEGLEGHFTKPFLVSYIPDNLVHAARFFFAKPVDQPSSLFLTLSGLVAGIFTLLFLLKVVRRQEVLKPGSVVVVWFMGGLCLHFLFMMCYFWGRFDDIVIRRLSLPSNLLLVIVVLFIQDQVLKKTAVKRIYCVGAAVFALSVSVPVMVSQAYNQEYLIAKETVWRRAFIKQHALRDYQVIDNDTTIWITHLVPAVSVETAKLLKDRLRFHLQNHSFSGVYVFQRFRIDPKSGKVTIRSEDELGPDFVLETVWEDHFRVLTSSRISRVVAIREGATVISADQEVPSGEKLPQDEAEIERARVDYLTHYLEMLP